MKVSPWDKSVKSRASASAQIAARRRENSASLRRPRSSSNRCPKKRWFTPTSFTCRTHTATKKLAEYLAPASTYFENSLGGRVVVFGSLPQGPNHLTESRKAQYVLLFNKLAPFSVWYDGDAEVYLKNFTLDDGSEFVAFTTVGIDPISPLTFGSTKSFTKAEMLGGDGKWRKVEFAQDARQKDFRASPRGSFCARNFALLQIANAADNLANKNAAPKGRRLLLHRLNAEHSKFFQNKRSEF